MEFKTLPRTLLSLCNKRVGKHIRRGFHEYMHDQKAKVNKTKEVVHL